MPAEVSSDPFVWKAIAGVFGVMTTIFGYFIRKRDEKIDENTKEVFSLREEVAILKTHLEVFSAEQAEMKESIRGIVDCVQDIRVYIAGMPNKSNDTK
jgi:hypothetical protein